MRAAGGSDGCEVGAAAEMATSVGWDVCGVTPWSPSSGGGPAVVRAAVGSGGREVAVGRLVAPGAAVGSGGCEVGAAAEMATSVGWDVCGVTPWSPSSGGGPAVVRAAVGSGGREVAVGRLVAPVR
ncbi:hypothetical protein, partial [Streptomyces bungoensis]|uniref:hypothetical protein n=1 Tax=Streptomyces bungoensis TaxID=285568 RepID=UPI001ABFD07B